MQYLIMLVVLAVVIGPVMWIMPSASQRKLVKLRQYAISKGFHIKVADMPQSHRQKVRKQDPVRGVYYSLPLLSKPKAGDEKFHYCLTRSDTDAEWLDDNVPVNASIMEQLLLKMPETVIAVEHASYGVAIYWQEKGDHNTVDDITQLLQTFRQALSLNENKESL